MTLLARILRVAAVAVVALVATIAVLELAFRAVGLELAGAPAPAEDGSSVILCIGDSHTRGPVDPDNYPAQLQRILDERAAGRYRVINVGIPGLNTAQIAARFERFLGYYRPKIVLHWAGLNNSWNYAERRDVRQSWQDRVVEESRILRFLRVAYFYRRLHAEIETPQLELHDWPGPDARFTSNFGGQADEIRSDDRPPRPTPEIEKLTHHDLRTMMAIAHERAIPMLLITYPLIGEYYQPVNEAVRQVATHYGMPVIDSVEAIAPAREEAAGAPLFDAWMHPTPVLYKHVAELVYATLLEQHLVEPASRSATASAGDASAAMNEIAGAPAGTARP